MSEIRTVVPGRFEQYQQSHLLLTLPELTEASYPISVEEPEPPSPQRQRKAAQAAPLLVTPGHIDFGLLPFWDEVTWQYMAPHAHTVVLIGDFTQWHQQPIVMAREGEAFVASLALPDGRYLYRFVVDGREVLDPMNPYQLSFTPHGVASLLRVQRWQRPLQITNQTRHSVTLTIASSHAWLQVTPTRLTLPAQGTSDITLAPQRHAMTQGSNKAQITLLPPMKRDKVTCTVAAQLDTPWLLVQPQVTTLDLGTCVRGTSTALEVPLQVYGVGDTEILLYNHGDATLHWRTVRSTTDQARRIECVTIPFHLGSLPRVEQGTCRVTLDTQCRVQNRRLYTVTVQYRLLFLRKDPPRLHFRNFSHNGVQCLTLRVTRSDGVTPQILVAMPPELAQGLEATQLSDNIWQFLACRQAFAESPRLEAVITLTDRLSGSRDAIRTLIDSNA